jgi:hypothetical protein
LQVIALRKNIWCVRILLLPMREQSTRTPNKTLRGEAADTTGKQIQILFIQGAAQRPILLIFYGTCSKWL